MAQEFYVRARDGVLGPLSPKRLKEMAQSGELTPEMLVSLDKSKWIRASSVKGLPFVASIQEDSEAGQQRDLVDRAMEETSGATGKRSVPRRPPTHLDEQEEEDFQEEDDHPGPPPPSKFAMFLNEDQDPRVVEDLVPKVSQILMAGEELKYIAIQKKPIVTLAPDCVVITNRRFIFYRVSLLGRKSFDDYVWRDLLDATLQEGLLGATFSAKIAGGRRLTIDYLPKSQARQVYRFAQEMEEKALEERRQRDLEAKRAAAGGVVIQGLPQLSMPQGAQAPAAPVDDPVQRLKRLKEMLDAGLITSQEFEAKKADILSRM